MLDLNAGRIEVRFPTNDAAGERTTFGEMTQLDPVFGSTHDPAAVADVLGLKAEDLAEKAPQTVSTGMAFCITALRSVEALQR